MAFQPVGWWERVLELVVALAYARVLVMVNVVDREDVSVIVVVPSHAPEGSEPSAAGVRASRMVANAAVKRILMEGW